jgi:hypothetical protein
VRKKNWFSSLLGRMNTPLCVGALRSNDVMPLSACRLVSIYLEEMKGWNMSSADI